MITIIVYTSVTCVTSFKLEVTLSNIICLISDGGSQNHAIFHDDLRSALLMRR